MRSRRLRTLYQFMPGLFIVLAAFAVQAAAEEPVWSVKMFQTGQDRRLMVESENLLVDFTENQAWTIHEIRYHGGEIVGQHGANGSVVSATPAEGNDSWIGTGHGKEKVRRYLILVDGNAWQYRSGANCTGNVIVLRKESNLGPLDHTAEITFPATGDRIIEKHSYKVAEDLNQRFNFVYAFMHCNNNALDQWLALLPGGEKSEGRAGRGDGSFLLRADVRAVIFYSPAIKKGVAYVYPKPYQGAAGFRNAIWDREHDNKLYFRPAISPTKYKVDDTLQYSLQVIPFAAEPDRWKGKGKELATEQDK